MPSTRMTELILRPNNAAIASLQILMFRCQKARTAGCSAADLTMSTRDVIEKWRAYLQPARHACSIDVRQVLTGQIELAVLIDGAFDRIAGGVGQRRREDGRDAERAGGDDVHARAGTRSRLEERLEHRREGDRICLRCRGPAEAPT